MHTYSDGTPVQVGDIVRRGKGKTAWRVTDLTDRDGTPIVGLRSTADDFTSASAFGDAIAALTPLTRTHTGKAPMTMTITAARIALSEAVTRAVHALPGRPTTPSEATITLAPEAGQMLRVIGSSYDAHIETVLPAQFPEGMPAIVAPARLAAEWLKIDNGPTTILAVEDRELVLTGARTLRATLPLVDPVEASSGPGNGLSVTVDRDALQDALKRTAGTVGKDATTPILAGVRLEAGGGVLRLTATDRYKVAQVEIPCIGSGTLEALPPHRALTNAVAQMGASVELVATGGVLWLLDGEGTRIRLSLLDGDYPNVQHLLQIEPPLTTILDAAALRAELSTASRLIGLTTSGRDSGVIVVTGADSDHVTVHTRTGDHSMSGAGAPVEAEGSELDIYLNPAYLLQALDAVTGEQVRLQHHGATDNKPLRLDATDSGSVAVLMPMRRPAT